MSPISLNLDRWPMVTTRWPPTYKLRDVEVFMQELVAVLARQEPFVTLADLSEAAVPTAQQMQAVATALNSYREPLRRYCKATGMVVTSLPMRAALNTFVWMNPLPHPFRAIADIHAAENWCWTQLAEARTALRSPP